MDCREFERLWNDRLDARGAPSGVGGRLDAHASSCPDCRALHAGFQAIASASPATAAVFTPPAGFADRTLDAFEAARPFRPRRLAPMAAAAALLAAVGLGWLARDAGRGGAKAPLAVAAPDPSGAADLKAAIAGARAATLDLAREARGAFGETGDGPPGDVETAGLSLPVAIGPPADVLRGLGDRLNAGVGPLEGTARQAFGFLLGPSDQAPAPLPRPREGV